MVLLKGMGIPLIVTVPVATSEPCVGMTNVGVVAAQAYANPSSPRPARTDSLLVASWLLATSFSANVRVVRPLAVILGWAEAAFTVVRLATPDPPVSTALRFTTSPTVSKQVTVIVPSVVPDVDLTTPLAFAVASGNPGGSVPCDGVAVVTGAVLSSLTRTEAELDNPAPFVAEQVYVVPAVSVDCVVGVHPVLLAIPEIGSVTLQVSVTLVSFQPAALGAGARVWVITGGVVSSLTVTETVVDNPAILVAVQVKVVPAVSVVTLLVVQPVEDVMLEPGVGSLTLQLTVTGEVVFHPAALGAGLMVGVTTGGVLSMLTGVVVKVAVLPAASVTTTDAVNPTPSVAIVTGLAGTADATPERLSVAV
jgi:hypothetical protein